VARAFLFRLEPLLDWCKRLEEAKRREFTGRRSALEECASDVARLSSAHEQWRSFADLRLRDAYLSSLDRRSAALRVRSLELRGGLDAARAAYVAARRERLVVEKLRERRRRAFEAEEARREEQELDEGNARRHGERLRKRLVR
jgi:flagellar protein FliJ